MIKETKIYFDLGWKDFDVLKKFCVRGEGSSEVLRDLKKWF